MEKERLLLIASKLDDEKRLIEKNTQIEKNLKDLERQEKEKQDKEKEKEVEKEKEK